MTLEITNEINNCRIVDDTRFANLDDFLEYCVDFLTVTPSNFEYYKFVKLLKSQSEDFKKSAATIYNNLDRLNDSLEVNGEKYISKVDHILGDYKINKLIKKIKTQEPLSKIRRFLSVITIDIIQYCEFCFNHEYSLSELTNQIHEIYSLSYIIDILSFCFDKKYFQECLTNHNGEHFEIYTSLIFSMYKENLNNTLSKEKHSDYLIMLNAINENISIRDRKIFQEKMFELNADLALSIFKLKCLKESIFTIAHFKKHNFEEEYDAKLKRLKAMNKEINHEPTVQEIVKNIRERNKSFSGFYKQIFDSFFNNLKVPYKLEHNIFFDIHTLLSWKNDEVAPEDAITLFFLKNGEINKDLIISKIESNDTNNFSFTYAFLCLLAQSIFFPCFSAPFMDDKMYEPLNKILGLTAGNKAVSKSLSDIEEISNLYVINKMLYSEFDMHICNIFIACLLNLKNKDVKDTLKKLLTEIKELYEAKFGNYDEAHIIAQSKSQMMLPEYTSIPATNFALNYIKKGILNVHKEPFYEIFINYLKLDSHFGMIFEEEESDEIDVFNEYINKNFFDSSNYTETARKFYELFKHFSSFQSMSNFHSKLSFDDFTKHFVSQISCEVLSNEFSFETFSNMTKIEQELIVISTAFYTVQSNTNFHRESGFKPFLQNSLKYAEIGKYRELVDILENKNVELQSQIKSKDDAIYMVKKEMSSEVEQKIQQATVSRDEEIRKLKKEIERLNKTVDKQNEEKKKLIDTVDELLDQFNKEDDVIEIISLKDVISDYKIAIIGGRVETNDELKRRYPNNIKTTDFKKDFDNSLVKNAQFIFIMTKFNNHGLFYKVKSIVTENQKYCYINSDNIDRIESEIANFIKKYDL